MISRAKRLILLVCTIAVILTIPIVAAAEAPVYADVAARKAQDMLLVPVLPNDAEEIGRILEQITAGANWPRPVFPCRGPSGRRSCCPGAGRHKPWCRAADHPVP